MSLSAFNWRYVGSQSFGTASVAAALDAFFTLGTAAAYFDTTTRTEGADSAGTWTGNRYQNAGVTEALYPVLPTNTLNFRALLAGAASTPSPSPTMGTLNGDTWSTNIIHVGMNKNSGAFATWQAASPFTSGQNSGLYRAWPTSAGTGTAYLWEAQEGIVGAIARTDGNIHCFAVGALVDPESADTSLDSESDGKLYCLAVSGSAGTLSSSFWTSGGSNDFFAHSASSAAHKCVVFTPGSATLLGAETLHRPKTAMTASGMKSRSGKYHRADLGLRCAAGSPNDQVLGRIREMFLYADEVTPRRQVNGATKVGYVVSSSTSTATDALFLAH